MEPWRPLHGRGRQKGGARKESDWEQPKGRTARERGHRECSKRKCGGEVPHRERGGGSERERRAEERLIWGGKEFTGDLLEQL